MADTYVYYVALPEGVNEMVVPCLSGYTIYIDKNLTFEERQDAYKHALAHVLDNDFDKSDVQTIEAYAHQQARKKR